MLSEEDLLIKNEAIAKPWIPKRYILVIIGFFGFANVYAMRVNLSVAILAMVNSTSSSSFDNSSDQTCPDNTQFFNSTPIHPNNGPFNWDEQMQGYILSSFFVGYVLTQVPGGRLAEKYGGKWIFGFGVFFTALLTLFTPLAAYTNFYLFIFIRILEGIFEGVTFPVMNVMLAQWAPIPERSRMVALTYTGSLFGTIISLPISSILCETLGWEFVFYIFGALGIFWTFFWTFFIYNSPSVHPTISPEEREFILSSINTHNHKKPQTVPWKSIVTSVHVWAILIAHVAQNFGFYTLLIDLPKYMKGILHYSLNQNALIASSPYFITLIFQILASNLADMMIQKNILSLGKTRKLFNSIGMIVPSIALVIMGYAGCNPYILLPLLFTIIGVNGFVVAGYNVNHIDIAHNYAGTLLGITNGAANCMGFVAPSLIGYIINEHNDIQHWRIVFIVAAVFYNVGNIVFVIFGTGEEQSWNHINEEVLSS